MSDLPPTPAANPTRPLHFSLWKRVLFNFAFLLLALAGSAFLVGALGRSLYQWRGFEVELRLVPAMEGQTRLSLKPLGEVTAHTHKTPVALVASLERVDAEQIQKLVSNTPTTEALAQDFQKTTRNTLKRFLEKQTLLAIVGGTFAPLLLGCRRLRQYLCGGALGACALGAVLGSAYLSFNPNAFREPQYTGVLKQAPWVIQFGKDAFTKIEALSAKLRLVATNLNTLYGHIAAVAPNSLTEDTPGAVRVLHISDIHNNPAALDFVAKVAEEFRIDFIVDTGDLTDLGSPPETVIAQRIAKLPYPYLFVAGNHDSQAVNMALARAKNVIVLNGQSAEVKGLRVVGLPNPASLRAGAGSVDTTPEELKESAEQLRDAVFAAPFPPDIVAAHDPKQADAIQGFVPLVLCGHLHRQYTSRLENPPISFEEAKHPLFPTFLSNAGTTGAAGLRYFEGTGGKAPFTCNVLFFRKGIPTRFQQNTEVPLPQTEVRPILQSIAQIHLDGALGEYSISFQTVESETAASMSP